MDLDQRQIVRMVAAGRVVVGAGLIVAPGLAGSQWIGPVARERAAKVMIRAMGIRDLALGAGTLWALDSGEPAKSWVLLSAASDTVDFGATLLGARAVGLRRALPTMAVAGAAAALGLAASQEID